MPAAAATTAHTCGLYRSTQAAHDCTTAQGPSTSTTRPDSPSPSLLMSLRCRGVGWLAGWMANVGS